MAPPIKLAYLVSHPIQYQAPLLRRIAADPEIDLTVFFCSASSLRAHHDEGFGRVIEWDVPLVDGYEHRFLPAIGDDRSPSVLRPLNYGLARALHEGGFEVLWTHGYTRLYNLASMFFAHRRGLLVLNRDEAWEGGMRRGPVKRAIKRIFFTGLRRVCDGWLAIGSRNRDYYLAQGMDADRIFSMPYAVDNDRFRGMAAEAAATRDALRAELDIAPGRPVVLFASKFQTRKRAADLVEAFARIAGDAACRAPYLVLVGDGEEHAALARQVAAHGLADSVRFAGFRNQSELPRFYDLCNVFVLPSVLEPWGLVVNEVMNAGRAVIASDQVGAAADLVRDGENGFVMPARDIAALAGALRAVLSDPERCRRMGARSLEIIGGWGLEQDLAGLKQALAQCRAEAPA
ncbi:MAG: glycosyltransferase [Alphaproteobacteria bacterium]|nr:glycosyltransferase [Alphaproteobacteria bacterium]